MTIDTSIEKLTHEKQCFIDEGWEDTGELEAYDMAVNIMHKYQKIKQIMKSKKLNALNIGLLIPKDMACVLHEIKGVMEDEKNQ